jgi:addiction module HigA family antidote
MKKNKIINEGGINGLGESLVNPRSKDFIGLQEMIKSAYKGQSKEDKVNNDFLSIRFQMESYLSSSINGSYLSVGSFIEKFLRAIGIKKNRFAEYIEYEYSNFISLMKDRRKINSDLAIKLGQIFKIDPVLWLHIQSKNDLSKQLKEKDSERKFSLKELLKEAS